MATKFLNNKTHRFYYQNNETGERDSYVLIFGDEVKTRQGQALSGPDFKRVEYRERVGEWKPPRSSDMSTKRSLEMYFLDVGQGEAAFFITPSDTKILVDGDLNATALGFLIWKYRLDIPDNHITIDHLFLSHADKHHVESLIPLLNHPQVDIGSIHHNGIGLFDSGFTTPLGSKSAGKLTTMHDRVAELDGLDLASGQGAVFGDWIQVVKDSGAQYRRLDRSAGTFDIGDPDIIVEILGPVMEPSGDSLRWLKNKSHTINGHSLVFRMSYKFIRTFFQAILMRRAAIISWNRLAHHWLSTHTSSKHHTLAIMSSARSYSMPSTQ